MQSQLLNKFSNLIVYNTGFFQRSEVVASYLSIENLQQKLSYSVIPYFKQNYKMKLKHSDLYATCSYMTRLSLLILTQWIGYRNTTSKQLTTQLHNGQPHQKKLNSNSTHNINATLHHHTLKKVQIKITHFLLCYNV